MRRVHLLPVLLSLLVVADAAADDVADAPHPGPCQMVTRCVGACEQPYGALDHARFSWKSQRLTGVERLQLRFEERASGPRIFAHRRVESWTLDAHGRPETVTVDRDGDGRPDETWSLSYDASPPVTPSGPPRDDYERAQPLLRFRPAAITYDRDRDGAPEARVAYTWSDDGRLASEQIDVGVDGSVENTVTHSLVDGEFQTWAEHDYPDADEMCFTHPSVRRDPQGRIAHTHRESSLCDTGMDETFTYDARGDLIKIETRLEGGDRTLTTFDYSCWDAPSP